MEVVASVVDRFKAFAKSTDEYVKGAMEKSLSPSNRRDPIEILKRLQRETFSDIMKLREKQAKLERMLSFNKSGMGSPFQEPSTHIRGVIDVSGALLVMGDADEQTKEALCRTGIKTGMESRFVFDTVIRQKDALMAEFVACHSGHVNNADIFHIPLSLDKVTYSANISDSLSAIAIPLGACCRDFEIGTISLKRRLFAEHPSSHPPTFNQYHGYAAGLSLKGSKFAGSLAKLFHGTNIQMDSTFGQLVYQPSILTRFKISCLHQLLRTPSQQSRIGSFAIPLGHLRRNRTPTDVKNQLIALILETELDESTRIGGWIELQKMSSKSVKWGVSMSDMPEEEFGWGLGVVGSENRLQLDGYLDFRLGDRFHLQPGVLYGTDGSTRIPSLLLRATWSL